MPDVVVGGVLGLLVGLSAGMAIGWGWPRVLDCTDPSRRLPHAPRVVVGKVALW